MPRKALRPRACQKCGTTFGALTHNVRLCPECYPSFLRAKYAASHDRPRVLAEEW